MNDLYVNVTLGKLLRIVDPIDQNELTSFRIEDECSEYVGIPAMYCDPDDPEYYLDRYKECVSNDPNRPEINWDANAEDIAFQLNQHYLCDHDFLVSWERILRAPIKTIDFFHGKIELAEQF